MNAGPTPTQGTYNTPYFPVDDAGVISKYLSFGHTLAAQTFQTTPILTFNQTNANSPGHDFDATSASC